MKRVTALLLAVFLCLGLLSACSGTTADPSASPSVEAEASMEPSAAPSATPSEALPEPSESPSMEPSEPPAAEPSATPSIQPSAAPTPTPTPTPTPAPTPAPSPTPAPTPTPKPAAPVGVDVDAFALRVTSNYTFSGFLARMDPDDETGRAMLDNYYPGLTALDLAQSAVYLCMISNNTGEFAIVAAKDAASASTAASIFQARINQMADGGAFYPEATEIWANSARVTVHGNYAMMVVHPQCDDIVSQFNALF